jgi:holo-[acyl-carrier protein] synthase
VSVLSLGVDLVSIGRVEGMLADKGGRVLARLLTDSERAYCESQPSPGRHIAARLAAKEAAYKAFQAVKGARNVGWRETEVVRDPDGRPELRFHGRAVEAAARLGVTKAFVSISHTDDNAIAMVILSSD